jgi:hypothetical protein
VREGELPILIKKAGTWQFWWLDRWRSTALRRRMASVDHCLGGAATHFALAASYFTDVRVIAVVGEDFLPEHEAVFTARH